jgi:2-polyprenyl-3-methyl-5-hydroxy-6-metoxy-1,4-benzoquinol methylase
MKKIRLEKYNISFYDKFYKQGFSVEGNLEYVDYLLKRLEDTPFRRGGKILDVGCGVGILGKTLKDKYNSSVDGIDLSRTAIKKALKNGLNAKVADIEKTWPFKDSQFDTVISQQVIEHLVNPDIFIEESKRVLKKGGYLVITTPNLASWFNRVLFLLGYQPFYTEISTQDKTLGMSFIRNFTKVRQPLGHLRVFTSRGLEDLLKYHNLKIVKLIGGKIFYLPNFMNPLDNFFSSFSSLSSDLIFIAKK